ncbi:Ig-like domain-containing protein [Pseudomonas nicosulfuronedens]
MMFDGAVAATAAEVAKTTDAQDAAVDKAGASKDNADTSHAATSDARSDAGQGAEAGSGRNVVFVDSRVEDAQQLLQGVAANTDVVFLDSRGNGVQQMAQYLAAHPGAASVQIIAHGNSGDLWLGNSYVSAENIADYGNSLSQLGASMQAGGDILIYACNTAQGERGQTFVDELASLTGRDIAASDDRTGQSSDWDLEVTTGTIEARPVLSTAAEAAYQHNLAIITVTTVSDTGLDQTFGANQAADFADGTGLSLREAINWAVSGDTIKFAPGLSGNTIALSGHASSASLLVIDKSLTIEGDIDGNGSADITLDGQYNGRVLEVRAGTVNLDGLVIQHGLVVGNGANAGSDATAAMGGAITNAGNLTLNNVTVTANAASGGGAGGGIKGGSTGGAGGGGGALGGQTGGRGGNTGNGMGYYSGRNGTANTGGNGGGYNLTVMGGRGGSSAGGAGGAGAFGYSNGGAGGTASSGSLSIGGGGGGSGWDNIGRTGAAATGGIFNDTTGTLTIVGNSLISSNIAAGGGGGGGGGNGAGASSDPGGVGGKGVGAIWNKGTLLITAANFNALSIGNNKGGSGSGGPGAGGMGSTPSSVDGLYNDGGVMNTAYNPVPTATIVVSNTSQHIGTTSLVTITFNQAVTGLTNSDLTVSNGTLSTVSTGDGGITWTATFTPNPSVTSGSNSITLDNSGVTSVSTNTAGTGTTLSNNYTVDTVRPTVSIMVSSSVLSTTAPATVNITFSEAVAGFTLGDMSASNGTLSNLSTSDNIHWTATLTPNAGNNSSGNVIVLDNTLYADAASNTGSGLTLSNTYSIDTTRPTATITVSNTALNIGGTSQVTITFSEAVNNFTLADLTAQDGTLSNLTTSDNITWTATLTPNSNVTQYGDVITLANSGVDDLAGNAGVGSSVSSAYSVDTQRPTASIVLSKTNIGLGQTAQVTITFSEAVTGFTNSDLTVDNGTLSAVSSSDGGVTWTATFTPTAGIDSASNSVTLDNTGVQDAAGNAGSGTISSNNYAIDGVRPTATVAIDHSSLIIGQTAQVTITFSEAVANFSNADLTVANGTLSAVSSSDGGVTWLATFTPTSNITNAINVITLDNTDYTDTAGNTGTGTTTSNNYAIDTQRPTATIVVSDPTLTAGETSLVTITFSEAVSGFTLADMSASHGTLSNLSSSDGGVTWTATLTPDANTHSTANVISLANTGVADLAGNTGSGTSSSANYSIDTVRPNATIVVANPSLAINGTSLVTISFDQAVTGFTNADLTVVGGTLSAVSSSDGGITWTATFTPAGNITSPTNHITLDNSGIQAAASGNAGTGITTSNNYAIDTQRPTATIVVANDHLGIGSSSLVTITFSEAVTDFTLADLTSNSGTLSSLTTSDNITFTATLTPSAGINQGNNHITLNNGAVVDIAGNVGTGAISNAYWVDSVRPTATIVLGDSSLLAGETSTVTITFSEAVTDFSNDDLSVANGTLSILSSSDGGITWTATYTPNTNIRSSGNLITLNNTGYTDLAGNTGIGVTHSASFTIDTVRPTATIVVGNPSLIAGSNSPVTITFSEAVSGFSNDDLTVTNGTLSVVTSSDGGITWTATFTPDSNVTDTSNIITLNNSGVENAAGNTGSGITTSNNYAIDTQQPTATITVADNNLGIGQTTTVTIAFSEVVNGFDLSDLSVANGTLSNLASSDGGRTWTATLTPTAAINDATNLILLDNALVSDGAGNSGLGIAISNNYRIDGTRPTSSIVMADTTLTVGETSLVTITFSEAVTGFSNDDLTLTNGTLSAVSSSDGGKTWTATFTPTAGINGLNNIIILDNAGCTDLAGNEGVNVSVSANYRVETVVPTANIVFAEPALKAGETSLVTITFSEAVSGFSNANLSVANGTLSAVSSSDGGITWTATFTPGTDITQAGNHISLDNTGVHSAAGNALGGSTVSNGFVIDTARPTATIVVAEPTLAIGQASQVTITFSEAVSGFDNADLNVANGSLSTVTSSDGGLTWTATFTPNAGVSDTRNVISLNNTGYTDAAGNTGTGATDSNTFAIDTQRPSATVVVANTDLRQGQSSQVTITFSEPVTDLDLSDLSASNATLSGLSSSDGGLTWTATLTPLLNVVGPSNVVTLNNLGYSDAAGNTGVGVSLSNNYAINSIAQQGDPQFRIDSGRQSLPPLTSNAVSVPDFGLATLGSAPLLDSSNAGSAQSLFSSVFREGPTQSQLALIFGNHGNSVFGDGSGHGFLGFGGGDAGVFGSSTISAIFGAAREGDERALSAFGQRQADISQGLQGVFGSAGLGQQLQEMNQREQRQVADLAHAFGELGQVRPAS